MKIAIVTMHGPNYSEIAAYTVPIMSNYAYKHGYKLYQIKLEDDNQWAYKKHEFFKKLFESINIDAIFYCDVDTMFTNHTLKIESFLDQENDYYATRDFNEINNGVCIIKNSIEGRWVNDAILECMGKYENEQNALNKLMESPQFNQYVKILPHPSINSYDYSLYPECLEYIGREDLGDWKPGNFLIHFPAIGLSDRVAMLKEYKEKIVR